MAADDLDLQLSIHPLCIATICDHYTRVTVGGSRLPKDYPVIGLLFGTHLGAHISINDAADAVYDLDASGIILNIHEIERLKALTVAVYPAYELLGWYTVGDGADAKPEHLQVHQAMATIVRGPPLFVLLNSAPLDLKQLPISIYMSEEVHGSEKEGSGLIFIDQSFRLETGAVESLAVEQITKATATNTLSLTEVKNQAMGVSIETFRSKLAVLHGCMCAMRDGVIPMDCELLRRVAKITRRLPRSLALDVGFGDELNECLMLTYLSLATKAASSLNDLTDVTTRTFSPHS